VVRRSFSIVPGVCSLARSKGGPVTPQYNKTKQYTVGHYENAKDMYQCPGGEAHVTSCEAKIRDLD